MTVPPPRKGKKYYPYDRTCHDRKNSTYSYTVTIDHTIDRSLGLI